LSKVSVVLKDIRAEWVLLDPRVVYWNFKEQGVTMWTGSLWFQMENTVLNLCISK